MSIERGVFRKLNEDVDCRSLTSWESAFAGALRSVCPVTKHRKFIRRLIFNVLGHTGLKVLGYKADYKAR